MFPGGHFSPRYFARRYFPAASGAVVDVPAIVATVVGSLAPTVAVSATSAVAIVSAAAAGAASGVSAVAAAVAASASRSAEHLVTIRARVSGVTIAEASVGALSDVETSSGEP